MVTLTELIEKSKYSNVSDLQIIKEYFDINDLEEEGFELIYELTQSKINKLKTYQRIIKEWISHLPSKYLYETYDLDLADNLYRLELSFLSNGCTLSGYWLKWAKENIPKMKVPKFYFRPLIEYLDKEGIRFKGEDPIKYYGFLENV